MAIAIQKYGLGVPFYRCGKWQNDLGAPLAPSTQWERSEHLSNSVFPVYKYLLTYAAEGEFYHADDTKNRILDVQKAINENNEQRVGIYTTAIISKVKDKEINLFFTGRSYAGENLDRLLAYRINENKAILMSDALRLNLPKEAKVLWAKCLGHARRNFFDYRDKYGQMVTYIIRQIGKIYHNEKKTLKMSDEERLKYHQRHSGPALIKLRRWALKKIYLKKIEPNEELGEAFGYFFNHYKELTF